MPRVRAQFVAAGADVLTTNSFVVTPFALARGRAPWDPPSASEAPRPEELAELQWIASRMGSAQGGVARQGDGTARGDAIVRWLLAQALAGSQEQAVTLADAMRRQGLLLPATKMVKFVGSASASYRLSQDVARHSAPP